MAHGLGLTTRAVWWLSAPHLYIKALQGPWPVQKQFNKDHEQRGRSKPGWRVVGSTTMAWLVTEDDRQCSFHCVFMSTDGKSDQMGYRDESLGSGWLKMSNWPFLMALCVWRKFGEGMLANTGNHWVFSRWGYYVFFNFSAVLEMCALYESIWYNVTPSYTDWNSCFKHWPFKETYSSQDAETLWRWNTHGSFNDSV